MADRKKSRAWSNSKELDAAREALDSFLNRCQEIPTREFFAQAADTVGTKIPASVKRAVDRINVRRALREQYTEVLDVSEVTAGDEIVEADGYELPAHKPNK
jgi:hypothetical protein